MTNFIPVFPLNIVVYPGETLNLHIFEPRYKQLVKECITGKKSFGLPPVLDKKMGDLGTLLEITEVVKEYDNGELDIRTRGTAVFRILETVQNLPEKLYEGAIVSYPQNILDGGDGSMARRIVEEVKRLYHLLNVQEKYPVEDQLKSYEIAHYVGFSQEQEYELLGLFNELQRLEYIRRHLNNIIPIIKELEEMKTRIKRNGHFRNLSLDDII